MKWLVIGTSPTVTDWLPIVRERYAFDATITTNAGIRLEPNPDAYVLVDQIACLEYHDEARRAQSAGAALITLRRNARAMQDRKIEHFDAFIDADTHDPPSRERFGRFRYSGPLCLEYACHRGAREIVIVGFDGYRKRNDYFDQNLKIGTQTEKCAQRSTHEVLRPACTDIARVWSDVQFRRYGNPAFQVPAKNWEDKTWETA